MQKKKVGIMCKILTVMLDKINNQFQIFESFTANKKKLKKDSKLKPLLMIEQKDS